MKLLIVGLLFFNTGYGRTSSFEFYGNRVALLDISKSEIDSIVKLRLVPVTVKCYVKDNIYSLNLDDWAIVLFLQNFVNAQFLNEGKSNRVRILSLLLTEAKINNGIGVKNINKLISLVSIDKKTEIVNDVGSIDEDGYKFIPVVQNRKLRRIRNLKVDCEAKRKDIELGYSLTPRLNNLSSRKRTLAFFNSTTKKEDSLTFYFSENYTKYSNDLPRVIPNANYYKAPPSPIFAYTIFKSLDSSISRCNNLIDSVIFLMRFVQTAVKFDEDIAIYGKDDFCSFPENTLAIGRGDCEDKCELFAFLIIHYFKDSDIVFLYNPIHIRIGLYNPRLPMISESYKEVEDKKYLVIELQDTRTDLGDSSLVDDIPEQIVK